MGVLRYIADNRCALPTLLLALMSLLLVGCGGGSGSDAGGVGASEKAVGVAVPAGPSLLAVEQARLRGFVTIVAPDGTERGCQLQISGEDAACEIRQVPPGAGYEVRIRWDYDDPVLGAVLVLAEASRRIEVGAGLNAALFEASDYTSPDDDGDGLSNLEEIRGNTNPNDANDPPALVAVPDVRGLPEGEARNQIGMARLDVGRVTSEPSTQARGNVIRQSPGGGAVVAVGTDVNLVVSSGSLVTVPNVEGRPEGEARAQIMAAGLDVGTVITEPSTQDPGTVIRQSPDAGEVVAEGTDVDLVVSADPAPQVTVEVPDLQGRTLGAARARIRSAGLTEGVVTRRPSTTVRSGRVVSQSPAAGARVAEGAAVDLVVSSGRIDDDDDDD